MKKLVSHAAALCALLSAGLLPGLASASPTGEQVVLGDVTFNRDGSVTVIQASDGAVIHYDSFDILAGELVQFVQPDEHARVLNRVFGDATHIDGTLLANGIVYIVNPAGVFLDGDAVVQVGGLVAAAGQISNEDFLAGVDRFDLTGPVVNASDAVRGDRVALLGARVENYGNITAPDGTIALVAGERVVLARLGGRVMVEVDGPALGSADAGVVQAGHVDAGSGQAILAVGDHYSLAINHEGVTRGGDVELRGGEDGLVLVSGEIDASSQATGGDIRVLGDRVALLGARLDASGGSGGGSIRVGGDVRGEGDLPTARRTFVDEHSVLRADATGSGNGGDVVVWGDEAAVMSGSISARGGATGGDGGFAEVSSLGLLDAEGAVDLSAPAGASGTLLFDPREIVIVGGSDDGSDDPDADPDQLAHGDPPTPGEILFGDDPAAEPFQIYESELEGTDANIVLEARHSITTEGTFGGDDVAILAGNDLTMRTRNDDGDETGSAMEAGIDLGSLALQTSDGGSITLATGTGGDAGGAAADIRVGDLHTSGADGDTGGDAGAVQVTAQGAGDVSVGSIAATGGAGATGAGGAGGAVTLTTADGSVTAASIDTSGGDGATDGGFAGRVRISAGMAGDLDVGDVTAHGGEADTDASGGMLNGGSGGNISLTTDDGSIRAGALDSSGGSGSTIDAASQGVHGSAGSVTVRAGTQGSGDLTLSGPVTAVDGFADADDDGKPDSFRSDVSVRLEADGAVEFDPGVVGPHIVTTEDVHLTGATVGAATPIEIDAMGLPEGIETDPRVLEIDASESAKVDVTDAGFSFLQLRARSAGADFDVEQVGVMAPDPADPQIAIEVVGDAGTNTLTVVGADLEDPDIPGGTGLLLELADELEDDMDEHLELRVGPDAIDGTTGVVLLSEDDLVLSEAGVEMRPVDGPSSGIVEIRADTDKDGDGAVLATGATVAIDMNAHDMNDTSPLFMSAGSGVGTPGAPIVTANVDGIEVQVTRPEDDPGTGGIHVVNAAGGDVTLGLGGDALLVTNSTGDIDFTNQAGDLVVAGDVQAGDGAGSGGSVALAVTDPDAQIRFQDPAGTQVDADGSVDLDGPVVLVFDADVTAGDDVSFGGTIDSSSLSQITRNLSVSAGGAVRFGGDVGSGFQLRNLMVDGATELSESRSFRALQTISFGSVDAASPDAAAMLVEAGDGVRFGGDVGASGRLLGLDVGSDHITFDADGDQVVVTGASGLGFGGAGLPAPPPTASIGKSGGNLDLVTEGALEVGPNHKLTVDGVASLTGESVRVGDVSALEIHVDSDALDDGEALGDFQVWARPGADFFVPGTGLVPDEGTDLVANVITTTGAPTLAGSGSPARFATLSGTVGGAGAGSFDVSALGAPVTSAALVDDSDPEAPVFFDLGIGVSDPGDETEAAPPELAPLLPARPGKQASAGTAAAPSADEVLAFLRCAVRGGREGSAKACARAPGSPLDSERGEDLARRYARLFGDSPEAEAARRLLAGPDREERTAVLRDFATLLAELRLLGMKPDEYEALRDRLLEHARGDTSREALLADVRAQGRGLPL